MRSRGNQNNEPKKAPETKVRKPSGDNRVSEKDKMMVLQKQIQQMQAQLNSQQQSGGNYQSKMQDDLNKIIELHHSMINEGSDDNKIN